MSEMTKAELTKWVKGRALELGFMDVGIAKAEFLDEEATRLRAWLDKGYHGTMSYMENHFEKRTDPTLLVENAQSVICFAYNYFTEKELESKEYKISKYAYGRDYHKVVKKKLKLLFNEMNEKHGPITGRYFVDSAPIMEREWAKRAGLGWVGKHTLIINPKKGSFFFLAEMVIDMELAYDEPISDYCGTCTKCITACPTDAISEKGFELDASKCISFLTIENKEEAIAESFTGQMEDWAFGCDICQDVCPWNRFSKPHIEENFLPKQALAEMKSEDWENLTQEKFDELFEGSPVKRTGYKGLQRNISFLKSQ